MPVKVVDASAIAALMFGEPEAGEAAAHLRGAALVAPALLPFEIASVCVKKLARHPEQRELLLAASRLYKRLEIAQHEVDLRGVVELAQQSGLSAYDASYLWLARHLRAELVTLDARLARASARI
ncbi:MAG: type II toxin-antitoxin system VapC family toxin [Methylocella sp.]